MKFINTKNVLFWYLRNKTERNKFSNTLIIKPIGKYKNIKFFTKINFCATKDYFT